MRRLAAEISFLIGLSFTILGVGVLFGSSVGGSRAAAVPASLFVLCGSILAFVAVHLHKQSRYLFFAAFLIQIGVFLMLIVTGAISAPLLRLWPLLSIFAGLALIPAGMHRYRKVRSSFVVPSLCFVVLGVLFLIFSFKVVPFSFKRFILEWWPLLLALAGVILTLASLSSRGASEEPGP